MTEQGKEVQQGCCIYSHSALFQKQNRFLLTTIMKWFSKEGNVCGCFGCTVTLEEQRDETPREPSFHCVERHKKRERQGMQTGTSERDIVLPLWHVRAHI